MDEPGSCVVTVTFDLGYSTQPELANSVSAESADAESALFFCVGTLLEHLGTNSTPLKIFKYFKIKYFGKNWVLTQVKCAVNRVCCFK